MRQYNDPLCQTCEIYKLKTRIRDLESENAFLRKDQDTQMNVTPALFYKLKGRRYLETPYNEPLSQENLYFLTITFDPNRFHQLGINAAAEEDYILHQVALATKDNLIHEIVGCFELQNNGTTHAHAHVKTYQPIELKKTLKGKFTNNMRNHKAIDLQPANKSEKGMAYINKLDTDKGCENKTWFKLINILKLPEETLEGNSLLNIGVCGSNVTQSQLALDGPLCSGTSFALDGACATLKRGIPKTVKKILKKNSNNLISFV